MKNDLIWLSDIHADGFGGSLVGHYEKLNRQRPAGVVVTGDIGNARRLDRDLAALSSSFSCLVYITLGNHDYYGGSFQRVQDQVRAICSQKTNLIYLDQHAPVWLTKKVALIGCQGWGDGRAGRRKFSVSMNDRLYIEDLIDQEEEAYLKLLRELGRASAAAFLGTAPPVLELAEHLILATHVPPFSKAVLKRIDFVPYYTNMALGRAILRVARQFPSKKISVYCGHTHQAALYRPLPNVSVHVAGASYDFFSVAGKIPIQSRPSK